MDKSLLKLIFEELYTSAKVKNQFDFGTKLGYSSGYITSALKLREIPHKMQKKLHEVFGISMEYMASNGAQGKMFPDPPAPEKNYPEINESYSFVNESIISLESTNPQLLMTRFFELMKEANQNTREANQNMAYFRDEEIERWQKTLEIQNK